MQLFIWYFEVILIIYPENVSSLGDNPDVLRRLFHYVLSRGLGTAWSKRKVFSPPLDHLSCIFSQCYSQSSIGRFAVLNLMHYSSQSSFLTTSDLGIESSNVAQKEKRQQALFSTYLTVF